MKILIIEDEKKLARLLKQGLEENGFTVDLAHDGVDGQYQVENYAYDAVLLDLMLPEVDGLTILASLRNQGSDVPVLIITARGEVEDRIKGLNRLSGQTLRSGRTHRPVADPHPEKPGQAFPAPHNDDYGQNLAGT